jgi:thiol-disulfide isomerase/thioredoxin
MNFMKHSIYFILLLFIIWSAKAELPERGFWVGHFIRQDKIQIPFYFQIEHTDDGYFELKLLNGEETIEPDKIIRQDDSTIVELAYFDTELRLKVTDRRNISGRWVDNSRENMQLPFIAIPADYESRHNFIVNDSKWEATFRPGAPNAYPGIIQMKSQSGIVNTAVRAPSGDFRYLNTYISNDSLYLFKFDGIVIYLLTAHIKEDSLVNGKMYSGPVYVSDWHAVRNEIASLPDAYERTKVVNNTPLVLKLRDIHGDSIVLDRNDFAGKITLLPIMGTWCPNCLDESRHIAAYLEKHPEMPVQVFGLCFERPKEWEKISLLLNKYTRSMELPYPLYYAGYADAPSASGVFPMLDGVKAFPTLVILDKSGQVRQVITGFDGPATGQAYDNHLKRFDTLMQTLSAE